MTRTAAIIGAGIGGLAAAAALGRAGWRVTVLERGPDLTGPGTALGIWPGALRALDSLGVGDRVRAEGVPQRAGAFRRPDGSRIGTLSVAGLERRTGEAVRLLSRPALVRILADAVPPGAIRFGSPADARTLTAGHDVVVAADGVFSRTRTALFGDDHRARYAGMTIWRGWLDGLPVDALTETWGRGVKFGVTPQEGGRANWYAAATAPEGTIEPTADESLRRLRALVGSWHDPIPALLDRVTPDRLLRHDLYVVRPLPTFVRGTTALIGDAAHAMTPDLGRGACEAVTDAVALADALADVPAGAAAGGVAAALRRYDAVRRPTVQRLHRASGAANRLAAWQRGTRFRDAALRLALRVPPAP